MNGLENAVKKLTSWTMIALGVLAVVALPSGCKKDKSQASNSKPQSTTSSNQSDALPPQTGPDAETILQRLRSAYAGANSYQDHAVLELNYRLNGRLISEPQPWSVAWDRRNRLAAQIFNSQIRGDGNVLSCFIYDIETANVDNQNLLIPYQTQLPLNRLYRDSIASHFLGGYAELPMDESKILTTAKIVPPTLSLLTGQLANGWLQNPSQTQRLADQTVAGRLCYVVRCMSASATADAWIDQQTMMLVQMSFPLTLLDPAVVTRPEITDATLIAHFYDAAIDGNIPDETFAIKSYPKSTPVRKFVALPETFPSELVGKTAPDFQLLTPDGKPRDRLSFDGKTTVLLWLVGEASYSAVDKLNVIIQEFPADQVNLGVVYSDGDLASTQPGTTQPKSSLQHYLSKSSAAAYYDSQLDASAALRIKTVPSVIVLDENSKIQFTRDIAKNSWSDDIVAAVKRVQQGDDVAGEMLAEYEKFLDSYHQQLQTVSAVELTDRKTGIPASQVSATVGQSRKNLRIAPVERWSNTEFKRPGNVTTSTLFGTSGPECLVFDGWQTVVELDASGKTKRRVPLELPQGQAVNVIRVGRSSTKQPVYAAFSVLDAQVFLFDNQWKPLGAYPNKPDPKSGIRDCRFTDLDADGVSELVVAFEGDAGIALVDPSTLQSEQISKSLITSLFSAGDDLVVARDGKLSKLKTDAGEPEKTELSFKRVTGVDVVAASPQAFCAMGVTSEGNWNAVGFDGSLARTWTLSIGSQFFENEIEPVAVAQMSTGQTVWAIGDADGVIHLVSGTGKWLGDLQSETTLHGIGLVANRDQVSLVVAGSDGVQCWDLNLQSE